jgi:predicted MFS family arabinose efflux permease
MSTTQTLTLPASHVRWWILGLLFACRTGLGLQFQTLGSVSDSLVAALGFSYAQVGTLIGLFMLPGLLLALPAGYMGRWASDRTLVALALLCMAAGGILAALAQGFGQLALGRLACGAGFVVSTIYLTKMTADWFAGKDLATALGLLVMSWPLGIAMGQAGQVWIDLHFGWPSVFATASLYCALGSVALFLLYRPPAEAAPAQAVAMGLPRRELLLTLLAATTWGLYNAGYVVYLSFAPRVLVAGGYGPAEAAAVISLASWAMIVSGALGGRIADRSGRGEQLFYLCSAVGIGALLLMQYTGLAIGLSLLYGLAGGAPAGVIMALTGEAMAPQRRAFGMGVFFSFYFVLLSLGPPLAGWLFDRSGDPFRPILFAVLLFIGAALSFRLFRVQQRRAA